MEAMEKPLDHSICMSSSEDNDQDMLSTTSSSSIYSISGDICRICHCEGSGEAPLITPCYCAGSLRYVHQECLQQWIKSSNIRCCELCKFQFIMETKMKPFNEWEYLEMSSFERKKLVCAMLFHITAMTCVCWSLYVLIDRTLDEVRRGPLQWPFWTKLVVVGIGSMGGVVFMYIQCKAYFLLCSSWKAYNRVIYIQNAPEKPEMPAGQLIASTSSECKPSYEYADYPLEGTSSTSKSGGNDSNSNPDGKYIDIKGVRNLKIFFDEQRPGPKLEPDSTEGRDFKAPPDKSWRIEIDRQKQADQADIDEEGVDEDQRRVVKLQINKAKIVIEFEREAGQKEKGCENCGEADEETKLLQEA